MARAKVSDYLHNFRFHVTVMGFGDASVSPRLIPGGGVSAGFSACSIPEASQEAVEYREGHYIYTRKYSGLPTIGNVTLSRGVALNDGTFWGWMKDVIEGNAEYRADLRIVHVHRDSKPATSTTAQPNTTMTVREAGSIVYACYNAFPTRTKVSSDLEATGSEVSIQEIELAIEYFNVEEPPPSP